MMAAMYAWRRGPGWLSGFMNKPGGKNGDRHPPLSQSLAHQGDYKVRILPPGQ